MMPSSLRVVREILRNAFVAATRETFVRINAQARSYAVITSASESACCYAMLSMRSWLSQALRVNLGLGVER